jgi:lipoprotein-anchoring transpeptidase ErfK/SrfK
MKFLAGNKTLMVAAFAASFVAALPAQNASAQTFGSLFDWKSSPEGRAVVNFSGNQSAGTVVVSFGDRRLYYVMPGKRAISYPIAIPKDEARWSGSFHVTAKQVNPAWTPTADMRRENPTLPAFVPGGHPKNPLGNRAIYIGETLYRIHGTDAPWTIGKPVSKGCIRLYNKDVVDLYDRVKLNAKVIITWDSYVDGKIKPIPSPYDEPKSGKKGSQDRSAAVRSRTSAR